MIGWRVRYDGARVIEVVCLGAGWFIETTFTSTGFIFLSAKDELDAYTQATRYLEGKTPTAPVAGSPALVDQDQGDGK